MSNLESLLQNAYERIASSRNPGEELCAVLADETRFDVYDSVIDDGEGINPRAYGMAEGSLSALISYMELENVSEGDFYQRLWEHVSTSPMFLEDDMKQAAMFVLFLHQSLPYYHLSDFSMTWDEYESRVAALDDECAKMRGLLYRNFENAGSAAAALLDLVTSPTDKRDEAVLMAYLVSLLRREDEDEEDDSE